ncbi:hypothetical protein AG1IA_10011 [Rhizoctonia solani AG-1 IA]|uniref:Uncharacterized protein n=1 Tax=Thanatephorus cucumeris (strain AG1-IA) TaxID=983506 RepID=L8WHU9_THACA|nr:hypothetical protein AG1IA_10011 [Rhizoctonia solani AG-1 IA]
MGYQIGNSFVTSPHEEHRIDLVSQAPDTFIRHTSMLPSIPHECSVLAYKDIMFADQTLVLLRCRVQMARYQNLTLCA